MLSWGHHMDPLVREMHSDSPRPEYLQFVREYILGGTADPVDPFARDPEPGSAAAMVYVRRPEVEEAVYRSGHTLISGLPGSGKTTLLMRTDPPASCAVLSVRLSISPSDPRNGADVLAKDFLTAHIAGAFWNELQRRLASDSLEKCIDLSAVEDPSWPQVLCWFYRNYPPSEETESDRKLAKWLRGQCEGEETGNSGDALSRLMRLVTRLRVPGLGPERGVLRGAIVGYFTRAELAPVCQDLGFGSDSISGETIELFAANLIDYCQRRGSTSRLLQVLAKHRSNFAWSDATRGIETPYGHIRLLIDGIEELPLNAQLSFVQATADLSADYGGLSLSAAVGSVLVPQLYRLDPFRRFRVQLYRLPPWTDQELRELIRGRLLTRTENGDFMSQSLLAGDIGEPDVMPDMPEAKLTRRARKRFVQIVALNAARSSALWDGTGAPVHALRLARALLTACTGCWERWGFSPPLDDEKLWRLCDVYWGVATKGGGEYARVSESRA